MPSSWRRVDDVEVLICRRAATNLIYALPGTPNTFCAVFWAGDAADGGGFEGDCFPVYNGDHLGTPNP